MIDKFKRYDVYLYILVAYIFSIAVRMIWVYQFHDTEAFKWDNQLMINTNDGYYFATVIKDMLYGTNPDNQLLKTAMDTYYGTVYSIYWAAKILPFSLDTIVLYAPAFISSLIVIPIILVMRLFGLSFVGFLSALLAAITWSFYNRTMIGYFDTDMYALVFPVFILYFIIKFVRQDKFYDIFIASVLTSVYVVFYPQGYAAITAVFIAYIFYGIFFIKDKKDFYFSIFFMSVSLIKIPFAVKLVLFAIGLYVRKQPILQKDKNPLYFALASLVAFILAGDGYSLILSKIDWYTKTGEEGIKLHFYDVAQTIREAGKIPFETFADRISGSILAFILAVIGYVVLVFRKKEFLLFLPLVGIGFFAYIGGLRFTVYAIPAMALGVVYLFYFIFDKFIHNEITRDIFVALASFAVIYPNIIHVINYKVPTVFLKDEVKVLDKLKNISNSKDYTLTWWDYGYPIWYYSETNTLIDGGKHHRDNYIVSKILTTSSQIQAVNLARISVETYVKKRLGYSSVANIIFKNKDPNKFLESLKSKDFKLPAKTRDIYLYLPNRMLNIFPTVNLFSNLDLKTGQIYPQNFFYQTQNFKDLGQEIELGNGLKLIKPKGALLLGNRLVPLNSFVVTEYDKSGKLHVQKQTINPNAPLSVVFMKNYHKFLVLDNKMFNSTFIQMFVLENYDKELFEPVIMTPLVKVYKLKR